MEASSNAKMEFSQLILGFSTAALHYLGETSIKDKEKVCQNLELAKQNIDIIEMLKDKTKGNLTPDENRLIEQLLGDLHVKYIEFKKA